MSDTSKIPSVEEQRRMKRDLTVSQAVLRAELALEHLDSCRYVKASDILHSAIRLFHAAEYGNWRE